MAYNFAFLAIMAVIYLAGLFGGVFRVDGITQAFLRGTQELTSVFKVPGKAKSEDLSCLKGILITDIWMREWIILSILWIRIRKVSEELKNI